MIPSPAHSLLMRAATFGAFGTLLACGNTSPACPPGQTPNSQGSACTELVTTEEPSDAGRFVDEERPPQQQGEPGEQRAVEVDASVPLPCYVDNDGDGIGAGDPLECPSFMADAGVGELGDGGLDDNSSLEGLDAIVYVGGDCDDNDSTVGPGFVELCDGRDNDCDDEVDEEIDRAPTTEECGDNIDNDCDGQIDEAQEDTIGLALWFQDCDRDGFPSWLTQQACQQPSTEHCDWVTTAPVVGSTLDCNDADPYTFPHAGYRFAASSSVADADADCDGEVYVEPTATIHAGTITYGVAHCTPADVERLRSGLCPSVQCAVWGAKDWEQDEGFVGTPRTSPPSDCVDGYLAIIAGPMRSNGECWLRLHNRGGTRCR